MMRRKRKSRSEWAAEAALYIFLAGVVGALMYYAVYLLYLILVG